MDSFSWERRSDILSFEEKAAIRSAIRKVHAFDDDYGAVSEEYGWEYWFHQFKFIYRLRNRKHVAKMLDALLRAKKKYSKGGSAMERVLRELDDED